MQDKLRLVVKREGHRYTTFVHIVSGHEKVTDNDLTRTKTAAKVSLHCTFIIVKENIFINYNNII